MVYNVGQFGGSCAHTLSRLGLNLACESRPAAYAYVPSFASILCRFAFEGRTPNAVIFSQLTFGDGAILWLSSDEVERGAQL